MPINNFDNLQPHQADALVSDPTGFGYLQINEEDSPIAIDAMVSVQNGKLMFVSSVKIGTIVGLLETEDPRLSLGQRRQRKPALRRIPRTWYITLLWDKDTPIQKFLKS